MTQDPRAQADSTGGIKLGNQESFGGATTFSGDPPQLAKLAQTLAEHGGGALSVDLALDIVLNDIVEQARNATGATGAAIALFRDGELVCRASAGENAPDLGVRVDAGSGLAGACVSSGEIQHSQDTDTDTRVNSEACRRLGVRSMLIAPLVDGLRLIGLIQVFSAWPDAFGKREISALQVLAGRIAESNREAETGVSMPEMHSELPVETARINPEPTQPECIEEVPAVEPEPRRGLDIWGTILMVLVIAAALALGLLIGWRRAAEFTKRNAQATQVSRKAPATAVPVPETPVSRDSSVADASAASATPEDVSIKKVPTAATPVGGLVVTQNGKVVYRSPTDSTQGAANKSIERLLIHKVDPAYPAEAKARNVQGPVVLDVQVFNDGSVGTIAVVSGDPLLTQAAIDAVKQWRYQPENGPGIERRTRVTVNFKLPGS
ncbi:MAG TPA: TonB family protein [Candidatus Sulfotelmatobacter sp.]|nr:TonB family protein [Candidatus Sulfotelmatobacter sp.]